MIVRMILHIHYMISFSANVDIVPRTKVTPGEREKTYSVSVRGVLSLIGLWNGCLDVLIVARGTTSMQNQLNCSCIRLEDLYSTSSLLNLSCFAIL